MFEGTTSTAYLLKLSATTLEKLQLIFCYHDVTNSETGGSGVQSVWHSPSQILTWKCQQLCYNKCSQEWPRPIWVCLKYNLSTVHCLLYWATYTKLPFLITTQKTQQLCYNKCNWYYAHSSDQIWIKWMGLKYNLSQERPRPKWVSLSTICPMPILLI